MEAVQQSLSVRNILLFFRFKAIIHLLFLRILNYWKASMDRERHNLFDQDYHEIVENA